MFKNFYFLTLIFVAQIIGTEKQESKYELEIIIDKPTYVCSAPSCCFKSYDFEKFKNHNVFHYSYFYLRVLNNCATRTSSSIIKSPGFFLPII